MFLNVEAGQHHASTIIIIAESGKFFFSVNKLLFTILRTCSKSENQRVASQYYKELFEVADESLVIIIIIASLPIVSQRSSKGSSGVESGL